MFAFGFAGAFGLFVNVGLFVILLRGFLQLRVLVSCMIGIMHGFVVFVV